MKKRYNLSFKQITRSGRSDLSSRSPSRYSHDRSRSPWVIIETAPEITENAPGIKPENAPETAPSIKPETAPETAPSIKPETASGIKLDHAPALYSAHRMQEGL